MQRGVPEGTPVVPVRDLPSRPRRNRKSETVRRAFSETYLDPGGCAVLFWRAGAVLGMGPRSSAWGLVAARTGMDCCGCCWRRAVIRFPIRMQKAVLLIADRPPLPLPSSPSPSPTACPP